MIENIHYVWLCTSNRRRCSSIAKRSVMPAMKSATRRAVLGALVMQSLVSGMVLLGLDAPLQDIVVGIVLVAAVAIDSWYRRRVAT